MFMSGTNQLIDVIEMQLQGPNGSLTVYIDVFDNSLSRKWLTAFFILPTLPL